MRKIELEKELDNTEVYGTFSTTIGGQLVEGGYDLKDGQLDIFCLSINGKHQAGYLLSTRTYNYLHDLVSEEF
jgi:hypothetical protein